MKKKSTKTKKITGWLLVLVIWLFVAASVGIINTFAQIITISQENFSWLDFIVSLIGTLLSLCAIFLALKRKKSFVNWALFKLWFSVVPIYILYVKYSLNGIAIGGPIVWAVLWTKYLKNSDNVKETLTN